MDVRTLSTFCAAARTLNFTSSRPTDRAMLGALALHFKVLDRIAFDWLYTFDFDAVSDALLAEDRV